MHGGGWEQGELGSENHFDPVNIINTPRRHYENAALIRDCFAKLGPYIKSCHAEDILLHDKLTVHLDRRRLNVRRLPITFAPYFANRPFAGNPAAVCPLDAWLPDDLLQAIAAENNLSETAFIVPSARGYVLRWFTPVAEVDLCGHATLATAHVLFHLLGYSGGTITFETRSGDLIVRRDGDALVMDRGEYPVTYRRSIPSCYRRGNAHGAKQRWTQVPWPLTL